MGYTVNFQDNQEINAEMLNTISEDIAGTTPSFEDGKVYGVEELNSISQEMITKGVKEGCNVTAKDGTVMISSGIAFFGSGKKIIIDSDGITLSYSLENKNYVWLCNDEETGVVSAKCTTSTPNGDFVMLAEVEKTGYVTVKKDIALMKNSSLMPNFYKKFTLYTTSSSATDRTQSVDLGDDYRRMVITPPSGNLTYIDWDEEKIYIAEDYKTKTYSVAKQPQIWISRSAAYIQIISYENNILTFSSGGYSTSFDMECI